MLASSRDPADAARSASWCWSWLFAALLLGCEAVTPASARAPAEATERAATTIPLGELRPPAPGEAELVGVVEERLAAGSYTYLAVRVGETQHWVATMGPGREPGERVKVRSMGTRTDFFSRRLDRTFSELVFGVVDDAV